VHLVRPHLDYAVSTWSPYLRRDIVSLTSLEERCPEKGHETGQPSLRAFTTTPAAEKLNLTALEERRPRGDLIQYYKEYSGTHIMNWHAAPITSTNNRTTRNSNPRFIVR